MLVLTRKQSETIQIGDSITITVLRMKGKSVRLGIEAPQHLSVVRGELVSEDVSTEPLKAEVSRDGKANATGKPASSAARQKPNGCWPTEAHAISGNKVAAWCI